MAERRMLAKSIMDSDAFSDLPIESQMLYVRLNLAADDDGFVSNPRSIMRMYGASNDSMKLLIEKNFVLAFQKGDNFVYLIKHWRVHNYIQKDRHKASTYREFLREVYLDENKAYSMNPDGHIPVISDRVSNVDTECIQDVSEMETQVRLGKDSIGKVIDSIDQDSIDQSINDNAPAAQSEIDSCNEKIIRFVKNGMYDVAAGLYRLYTAQGLDVIYPGDVKT